MAKNNPLFDNRIVTKPQKLSSPDRAGWTDWKFQFENFLTVKDADLDEMNYAAAAADPLTDQLPADTLRRAILLFCSGN